jgi:hypothetical protein
MQDIFPSCLQYTQALERIGLLIGGISGCKGNYISHLPMPVDGWMDEYVGYYDTTKNQVYTATVQYHSSDSMFCVFFREPHGKMSPSV